MGTVLYVCTGVFWTIAVGLMIAAPTAPDPTYCMAWSLLTTIVAAVLTGALLLRCERHRIETVARVAVQAADEHRRLESI